MASIRNIAVVAACLCLLSGAARAASDTDLTSVFDQFNDAVRAGQIDKALSFRTQKQRQQIAAELRDVKKRQQSLEFMKAVTPGSYTVEHVERLPGGRKATVYILGQYNPDGRKVFQSEESLLFEKEGGAWKLADIALGADPATIKRSPDEDFEPSSHYVDGKTTQLGGRIVKTEFFTEYTVVTLRVIDEDDIIFLPPKEEIQQSKFDLKYLEPWNFLEIEARPHLKNKYKFLGVHVSKINFE